MGSFLFVYVMESRCWRLLNVNAHAWITFGAHSELESVLCLKMEKCWESTNENKDNVLSW